ncbi:MAG TPA: hypothetical protein PLF30_00480 [Candidatus Moranbacteria bacterium]|jgi:chromosome segregation ATPase|nr:hypothetical protein [Candidatus Moranbacteria bacterium]HOF42521.1 hypothetical protein [Candidatus Moranbacteria bacterium]HPX94029.1 hypothetical protein [Candidatus Moranbacteria bacterium]HQB59244.1 hypothetical protein [Candidatus Moranbacteria bacterium]
MNPEISAQKKKMQMEILLKESDVKKFERVKVELEIALRDIKQKEAQLQADKASKESRLKRTEEDITQLRNEIIKLKRQMNMLGH